MHELDSKLPWFAARVKSRCEKVVNAALQGKGYETLLPVCRVRRHWGGRQFGVELPLFPGYTFAAFHPEQRLPILTTPGLIHLVGLGKTPIPLDDVEVRNIHRVVESGLNAEPWPFLEIGQRVVVRDGPLSGIEGILLEFKNRRQLVISITLLRRSVAVAVRGEWIQPASGSGDTKQSPVRRSSSR